MSTTRQEVIAFLSNMNPLELSALVKELEDTWKVSATMAPTLPPPIEPPTPEPTEFDAVLTDAGERKLVVVRALRKAVPQLDLRAARDLVNELPAVVQAGLERTDAEALAEALREAGAAVEVTAS